MVKCCRVDQDYKRGEKKTPSGSFKMAKKASVEVKIVIVEMIFFYIYKQAVISIISFYQALLDGVQIPLLLILPLMFQINSFN